MYGKITSFVIEKGFGFIHGEDGKDYFFHANDFSGSRPEAFTDGLPVHFDPTATPKGYRAHRCKTVDTASLGFEAPDSLLTSKENNIKGWAVVQHCDWVIESDWTQDKEAALAQCKVRAEKLGANALLEFSYKRKTDSEGNYHFTAFQYVGRPAFVARKSPAGKLREGSFPPLNENAESIKRAHEVETEECLQRKKAYWKKVRYAIIASIIITIFVHKIEIFWVAVAFFVYLMLKGIYVDAENTPSILWISKKPASTSMKNVDFKPS